MHFFLIFNYVISLFKINSNEESEEFLAYNSNFSSKSFSSPSIFCRYIMNVNKVKFF